MISEVAPSVTAPRPKSEPITVDDSPVVIAAPAMKLPGIIVLAPSVVAAPEIQKICEGCAPLIYLIVKSAAIVIAAVVLNTKIEL